VAHEPYFASTLSAARAGAPWAWEAIYKEYAPGVTGYARGKGVRDPEDVTSETFLNVARDIHRFTGDASDFRAWLYTIAHRRVQDEFRKQGREVPRADGVEPQVVTSDRVLGNVEHEALGNMSMLEVGAIIRTLSKRQRDVLLLRVVGDLSVAETANVLNTSEGVVKTTQSRALETLRQKISEIQ
jgi:RNA polymerase sigma-70 factor (ECF subfamily)